MEMVSLLPFKSHALRTGRERGHRRWDGWMASWTQWTWVWANAGRQWRTRKPGVHGVTESDMTWGVNNHLLLIRLWITILKLNYMFLPSLVCWDYFLWVSERWAQNKSGRWSEEMGGLISTNFEVITAFLWSKLHNLLIHDLFQITSL